MKKGHKPTKRGRPPGSTTGQRNRSLYDKAKPDGSGASSESVSFSREDTAAFEAFRSSTGKGKTDYVRHLRTMASSVATLEKLKEDIAKVIDEKLTQPEHTPRKPEIPQEELTRCIRFYMHYARVVHSLFPSVPKPDPADLKMTEVGPYRKPWEDFFKSCYNSAQKADDKFLTAYGIIFDASYSYHHNYFPYRELPDECLINQALCKTWHRLLVSGCLTDATFQRALRLGREISGFPNHTPNA